MHVEKSFLIGKGLTKFKIVDFHYQGIKNIMRSSNPIHPGEMLLKEFIEPSEMSQRTFVKRVGWSTSKLGKLIRGKSRITAYSALNLATTLKTTPELWLRCKFIMI